MVGVPYVPPYIIGSLLPHPKRWLARAKRGCGAWGRGGENQFRDTANYSRSMLSTGQMLRYIGLGQNCSLKARNLHSQPMTVPKRRILIGPHEKRTGKQVQSLTLIEA